MESVTLKHGRERSLSRRHPWVYSGGVLECNSSIGAGETVVVRSDNGDILGYGSYSPFSQIRVRMLSLDAAIVPDEEYIKRLVVESVSRRELRSATRLVNAENDGLPGVVADFYSGWVVCQFTSAGADFWKGAIADSLMKCVLGCRGVAERMDVDIRIREGLQVGAFSMLRGDEPPEFIEIDENGIRFLVDVRNGHKTGFYLDQRDARAEVRSLAAGRDVLNCFCYTGGFGIAAAVGGAKSVTQVDVSEPALALAKRNAELNGADAQTVFEYVADDVFKYLRKCRDEGRFFDMIVLDPPKFAEVRAHVMRAARGYKDINLLAMKLLRPGGILATFSCSGAMDEELFMKILAEAAADAQRDLQIVGRTGHPSDHPVSLSFPEGRYLKGVIVKLRNCGNVKL